MKALRRFFTLTLALIVVMACVPTAASADGAWIGTILEQCSAAVPEVKAYLYPIDEDYEVIHGLNENSVSIEATLGDEKLKVETFKNAKDMGGLYIVLVNATSNGTGYEYLNIIKDELAKWIDDLGEKDKFVLISYTDEFTVQLDGTESRDSAKRIVANIQQAAKTANTISAVKEAIRIAGLEENSAIDRRVLVMYDNGDFLDSGALVCDELLNNLVTEGLPLYTLCNHSYSDRQDKMAEFAQPTGGNNFTVTGSNRKAITEQFRSWLNSCYVMELRGESNDLQPRERMLTITFSDGQGSQTVQRSVSIKKNIPDNESPTVKEVKYDDENTEVRIAFSESVKGADKAENYTLTEKRSGKELTIGSVDYDSAAYSASLTLEKALSGGDYCIEFRNITDTSYEANELQLEDGAEQYEFTVDGNSTVIVIIICAAVLVCGAAAAIIIINSKKKKRREEQARLEAKQRAEEEAKRKAERLNAARQGVKDMKFAEDRAALLPVSLLMVLPNGLKSKADITVGERFSIGRNGKRCDLAISDDMISGLHLTLSYTRGILTVADAGSTNGTFVNGIKIDKPRQLQNGDTIVIGKTKISVNFG